MILLALIAVGCSTKKNTYVSRSYHNVTAHYNAYFNGKEALKAGIARVEDANNDNYITILNVFEYSDPQAATTSVADMDKAIKKASKVIKLHSITAKPKRKRGKKTEKQRLFYKQPEYCKWVDDSYLMMGKAYFYMHEFGPAKTNFKFIIATYKNDPSSFIAKLWLAKAYNETKRYKKSEDLLAILSGNKDVPEKYKSEIAAIYADLFIKQKQYDDAIPKLQEAINGKIPKKEEARYRYILAQLYQKKGDLKQASDYYAQVVKLNPTYDMAFNAKINRASCYDKNHGDSKGLIKELNKMLKDDKNIDYHDQIYFALGKIEQGEGNQQEAINYYKRSLAATVANDDQQSVTYLTIADIYFNDLDYGNAQAYYDSSVALLDENYPDYEMIAAKAKNLTELVKYLNVIDREDSLQTVAAMPKKQINAIVKGLIKQAKEEEIQKKKEEQGSGISSHAQNQRNQRFGAQGGKWYFYNPTALSFGQTEFVKRWGRRKLEDNWRRKNKAMVVDMSMDDEMDEDSTNVEAKITDNQKPEYYLQDLPLTDSLMNVSNGNMEVAYFKSAEVYRDKLVDYPKSIEQFEAMLARYPNSDEELVVAYELYKLFYQLKNTTKTSYYKNLILSKYPESQYAKILTDPEYLKKLEKDQNKAKDLYLETYRLFQAGDYNKVYNNCVEAEKTIFDEELNDKFIFLKALTSGETEGMVKMIENLNAFIKTYPSSELRPRAEDLLVKIKSGSLNDTTSINTELQAKEVKDKLKEIEENKIKEEISIYKFDAMAPHIYAFIVLNSRAKYKQTKFKLVVYNTDAHTMDKLKVKLDQLNQYPYITVSSFKNKRIAQEYLDGVKGKEKIFEGYSDEDFKQFVISTDNFEVFKKDKNVETYMKFYERNY